MGSRRSTSLAVPTSMVFVSRNGVVVAVGWIWAKMASIAFRCSTRALTMMRPETPSLTICASAAPSCGLAVNWSL